MWKSLQSISGDALTRVLNMNTLSVVGLCCLEEKLLL